MLLGTSYYPEITDASEWEQDLSHMRSASMDTLRICEFAWSAMEPHEGYYQFDWLDSFIELAHGLGFKIIMSTPTATPPPWLTTQYPEIMIVRRDGTRHHPGGRRDADVCHEIYQHYSVQIAAILAERYGQHPAIIGWQIDNELIGPEGVPPESHSASATFRFRQHLKRVHGDLETLNKRWGTRFWSQEYSDWGEVGTPLNSRSCMGQVLDYSRFFSESIRHFIKLQYQAIRPHIPDEVWISTNATAVFDRGLDHQDWAQEIDTVGWDAYRAGSFGGSALGHDLFRTAKRQPFWVFETNSLTDNITPSFWGEMRAHGAQGIIVWHWRNHPANAENETNTVCDWGGIPDPRRVKFVQDIAAREELNAPIPPAYPRTRAAFLFCPDCARTALTPDPYIHKRNEIPYISRLVKTYQVLARLGIAMDVIQPGADLDGYDLLIMPSAQLLSREFADSIREFVAKGGTLLGVAKTMHKDTWAHNYKTPGEPLAEVLGFSMLRNRTLPATTDIIHAQFGESVIDCLPFVETVYPTTAQVEATFIDGLAKDHPAALSHRYQKGSVYYATAFSEGLIHRLATRAAKDAGIPCYEPLGDNVAILPDLLGDGVWLFNHEATPLTLEDLTIPAGDYVKLPNDDPRLKRIPIK